MKRKKALIITPTPPKVWYFRDRNGVHYGPYRDGIHDKDTVYVLRNYVVDDHFRSAKVRHDDGLIIYPATDLVMEDGTYQPVDPAVWTKAYEAKQRVERIKKSHAKYGYPDYVYRSDPVPHTGGHGCGNMWKSPNFGRKVRDTGHGYTEDMEPRIRARLRVPSRYAGDDFPSVRPQRSWKVHRRTQWK